MKGWMLTAIVCGCALSAQAATLEIDPLTVHPGESATLVVRLPDNTDRYVAIGNEIILPAGLEVPDFSCIPPGSHRGGGNRIVDRTDDGAVMRIAVLSLVTVEVPLPAGEIYHCPVIVPDDAVPGTYAMQCQFAHGAVCADPETRDCALEPIYLECPAAMLTIEEPYPPTPTPTAVPIMPPVDPNRSGQIKLVGADGGASGCQMADMSADPSAAALLVLGLLVAVMVHPRG